MRHLLPKLVYQIRLNLSRNMILNFSRQKLVQKWLMMDCLKNSITGAMKIFCHLICKKTEEIYMKYMSGDYDGIIIKQKEGRRLPSSTIQTR